MATINKKDANAFCFRTRQKVAAYARISMETDTLLHSLSAQVSHYSQMIQANPEWQYAGVYVDEGITGTSTTHRDEFKRLLMDCDAGKIDLILTKSISRFARDTVDCLNAVRHLKDIGIEVFFEREHISTFDGGGELLLTLLAAFAQAESESISANVSWAIRTKFQEGLQNGYKAPYGYYWDGEMYRLIPEQAEVVKSIFQRYLAGETAYSIAKSLTKSGIKGQNGKDFRDFTVKDILSNHDYTGTQLLQRNFMSNHVRKRNNGELPMYAVEEMFEPLISVDEYEQAQRIREKRANEMPPSEITRFSGLVKCGSCGCGISRRSHRRNKNWVCNNRERKGIAYCQTRPIREAELNNAVQSAFGEIDDLDFCKEVRKIVVFNDRVEFHCLQGKVMSIDRQYGGFKFRNGFSGKLFCGLCGTKCGRDTLRRKIAGNTVMVKSWSCSALRSVCPLKRIDEEEIRLASDTLLSKTDSEASFAEKVQRADIFNDRIEFHFKGGEVKTWRRG
jgi:site-specific DNA recombinase